MRIRWPPAACRYMARAYSKGVLSGPAGPGSAHSFPSQHLPHQCTALYLQSAFFVWRRKKFKVLPGLMSARPSSSSLFRVPLVSNSSVSMRCKARSLIPAPPQMPSLVSLTVRNSVSVRLTPETRGGIWDSQRGLIIRGFSYSAATWGCGLGSAILIEKSVERLHRRQTKAQLLQVTQLRVQSPVELNVLSLQVHPCPLPQIGCPGTQFGRKMNEKNHCFGPMSFYGWKNRPTEHQGRDGRTLLPKLFLVETRNSRGFAFFQAVT